MLGTPQRIYFCVLPSCIVYWCGKKQPCSRMINIKRIFFFDNTYCDGTGYPHGSAKTSLHRSIFHSVRCETSYVKCIKSFRMYLRVYRHFSLSHCERNDFQQCCDHVLELSDSFKIFLKEVSTVFVCHLVQLLFHSAVFL